MLKGRPEGGERGEAAVEFALVAPLLFALIAFTISVYLGMTKQSQLERVAEVAARAASVPYELNNSGVVYRTAAQITDHVDATTSGDFESLVFTASDGAEIQPEDIAAGQTFGVTATDTWRNPLWGMVNLLGGGAATESNTLAAQATGVRE